MIEQPRHKLVFGRKPRRRKLDPTRDTRASEDQSPAGANQTPAAAEKETQRPDKAAEECRKIRIVQVPDALLHRGFSYGLVVPINAFGRGCVHVTAPNGEETCVHNSEFEFA